MHEGIERLMAGRTVVMVAHRMRTVRRADRVVFVDDGRIVEEGSHDELLHRSRPLRRLLEHFHGAGSEGIAAMLDPLLPDRHVRSWREVAKRVAVSTHVAAGWEEVPAPATPTSSPCAGKGAAGRARGGGGGAVPRAGRRAWGVVWADPGRQGLRPGRVDRPLGRPQPGEGTPRPGRVGPRTGTTAGSPPGVLAEASCTARCEGRLVARMGVDAARLEGHEHVGHERVHRPAEPRHVRRDGPLGRRPCRLPRGVRLAVLHASGAVVVWLSKVNRTYEVACAAGFLAVHLLTPDQYELAALFGGETGDRAGQVRAHALDGEARRGRRPAGRVRMVRRQDRAADRRGRSRRIRPGPGESGGQERPTAGRCCASRTRSRSNRASGGIGEVPHPPRALVRRPLKAAALPALERPCRGRCLEGVVPARNDSQNPRQSTGHQRSFATRKLTAGGHEALRYAQPRSNERRRTGRRPAGAQSTGKET